MWGGEGRGRGHGREGTPASGLHPLKLNPRLNPAPAHHSHPPSHIHRSIPGSKLTCSTSLFHHILLAPTWTAFSDYTGPDFSAQRFSFFVIIFLLFFFILGRAVD